MITLTQCGGFFGAIAALNWHSLRALFVPLWALRFNTCLRLALEQSPEVRPQLIAPCGAEASQAVPGLPCGAVTPVQPRGPWLTQALCVRGARGALPGTPLPSARQWLKGWAIFLYCWGSGCSLCSRSIMGGFPPIQIQVFPPACIPK